MKRFARNNNRSRPGITAVMAMIYMTLFATMAIGFYASVTTSVKIASNEQTHVRSIRAAESGMAFMKYHLANLGIPSNTDPNLLFDEVFDSLSARLNGFANMGGYTVHKSGDRITVPSPGAWMKIDNDGSEFYCVLDKEANGQQLKVKVVGKFGGSTAAAASARGLQLHYAIAKDAAQIFNYGVAAKSAISMNGNVEVKGAVGNEAMGSVLSASTSSIPLVMTGSAVISGDASFTNPTATISISSTATIAGLKPTQPGFSSHIHRGVAEVPFPVIDTTAFEQFVPSDTATGTGVLTDSNPPGGTYTNIRIKAGTNPTFNSTTQLKGVVYIEQPNKITFNGALNLQGAIVVETDANSNESLDPSVNTLFFGGAVTAQGIETLPDTTEFPPALRALKGSMLLAPGFGTTFTGNFGTVSGSIVASKLAFSGSAGGTVKGSIINMKDSNSAVSFSGTADITIESQGTSNYPAGVFFGSHYAPLPATYKEVAP